MATYPASIASFSTKVNLTTIVDAGDPNSIQAEVVATETTLGTNPHVGVTQNPATYVASNRTFSDVSTRIANVEHGLVADTHTQYVHKSGGDSIVPGSGTVALTLQANGANALVIKNTSGTVEGYFDTNGVLYLGGAQAVDQSQAAGSVTTQAAGDAGTVGASTNYARQDHKHAMPAADPAAGTAGFRTLGTGSQQAAAGNHNHTSLDLTTFTEGKADVTASGATTTLDLSAGDVFKVAMNASTTFAFSNVPASGKTASITIVAIQDATGGRTITWPASVKWSNGVQPTQNTTANSVNIYSLFTYDGGATFYAFLSGKGMA